MVLDMASNNANIFSIFASIQGEGLYIGKPQLFIRFTGCNIRCDYCDTQDAVLPQAFARIEEVPFTGNMKLTSNPLSVDVIAALIRHLNSLFNGFHAIALTGGEPLLQSGFLKNLLPLLKQIGLPLLLETNGTLPKQLSGVIDLVDIVSMDIKTPSSVQKERIDWNKTNDFLKIASKRNCYVKIVVNSSTMDDEFAAACSIVAQANPQPVVIIQPAFNKTNHSNNLKNEAPPLKRLLEVYQILQCQINDIRIIPQIHKLMGWT